MNNLHIGSNGIKLIEAKEGFRPTMYLDAANLPTIGFGTLIDTKEEEYPKTATITREQAEGLLKNDCLSFEKTVNLAVTAPLNQNQFDALVCLVYNIGSGNFRSSSVLKSINSKESEAIIRNNWAKWNKADGRILPGLVKRRQEEVNLFFTI